MVSEQSTRQLSLRLNRNQHARDTAYPCTSSAGWLGAQVNVATHLLLLIMDSNTGNVLTELMQARQTLKMWEGKTMKGCWLLNVESGALQRDRVPGLPRPSSHTRTSSICPASPLRNVSERKMDAVTCLHHFHLPLKYRLDAVGQSWKGNKSLEKDKRITKTLVWVCDYVRLSVCRWCFFLEIWAHLFCSCLLLSQQDDKSCPPQRSNQSKIYFMATIAALGSISQDPSREDIRFQLLNGRVCVFLFRNKRRQREMCWTSSLSESWVRQGCYSQ